MITGTSLWAGVVWAMLEPAIRVVCERLRAAVGDPAVLVAAGEDRERPFETTGTVAVIPVVGEIFPRANLYTYYYGGASLDRIRQQFRKALADDTIKAVVFRVDSPGGLVDGVPEFTAEVLKARGTKPIVALADTLMCSAAYWIASAADEVSATPSARVGSIGCYTQHEDVSRMLDTAGITVTLIASDPRKVEGNSYEPLSDEAHAQLKGVVDDVAGTFRADVAKGRGVTAAHVKQHFGEGRVFSAKDAKAAGLIDRVETFDQLLTRVAGGRRSGVRAEGPDAPVVAAAVADPPVVAAGTGEPEPAARAGEPPAPTPDDAVARDQAFLATVVDYVERVGRA